MLATGIYPSRFSAVCRRPDLQEYERQKTLTVSQSRDRTASDRHSRVSDTYSLFEQRIKCLLEGPQLPGIYPGAVVPALGGSALQRDRGRSFFSQYKEFKSVAQNWHARNFCASPIKRDSFWPWRFVQKPLLQEISETDVSSPSSSYLSAEHLAYHLLQARHHNSLPSLLTSLNIVRSAWDAESLTINQVRCYEHSLLTLLQPLTSIVSPSTALAVAFELDAFASFKDVQNYDHIFGHWFDDNFVIVVSRKLSDLRLTELCQNDRLFDELLNLTQAKFAPVVVNEYDTIADGNHRITSVWIWNVLKYCQMHKWDLEDIDFQKAIAEFIGKSPISRPQTHEVLHHLGAFLADEAKRAQVETSLRQALTAHPPVTYVPVLPLPEYLSGAVQKFEYDTGRGIRRCHHKTYQYLQEHPDTILKPRASYHFTDAVLMPWFSVLSLQ
jgi:hypothetical protein